MQITKPSALVVDDEITVSMYLAEKLEEIGFNVSIAGNAEDALALSHGGDTFSVAFIDLALPGRSGLELIADLTARLPDLPIVIASGYGLMASRDVDHNNRPPAVLSKPYDGEKVLRLLMNLGISIPQPPAAE